MGEGEGDIYTDETHCVWLCDCVSVLGKILNKIDAMV